MAHKHDRDRVPSNRRVEGEGPVPARIMLIGEGPSGVEDELRRPFVGPSGRVLDQLLINNGLDRDAIRITNVVKKWKGYGYKTMWADVLEYSDEMGVELANCQPKYVGLLGAWAVRWFFEGEDVRLDWAHGLPFERNGWTVMPIYHPANVFSAPDLSPRLVSDMQQFAAMIKGRLQVQEMQDALPDAEYVELKTPSQVYGTFQGQNSKIYVDTEGWYFNAWGLSYAFEPGQGYVVHRESTSAIAEFIACIHRGNYTVILHNSLHDIEVLAALGLDPGSYQFEDTMVKAHLLCVEEQGLKPLAKRHCGMEQDEYEDIIGAAELEISMMYLYKVQEWAAKWQNSTSISASPKSSKTSSQAKSAKTASPSTPASAGRPSQTTMKFPA